MSCAASTVAVSAAASHYQHGLFVPPPPKSSNPNPPRIQYKSNRRSISTRSLQISDLKHLTPPVPPYSQTTLSVAEKLDILVSEFRSLPKPIDRVKRLIHYASLLPELEESAKVESNRVWMYRAGVAGGGDGRPWIDEIQVDSDSEIMKGFCYYLIWLLDGSATDDVIETRVDDLSLAEGEPGDSETRDCRQGLKCNLGRESS